MKLSLSVKITLKDFFPKYKSIPYENFVCLIKHNNNIIAQIRFPNFSNNNYFNHKVESINSNIIYNFHIIDSYKKSLIGISHLCINFDKVKNLNINDILTQEGNHKLIIDSTTKRKFFDTITNMGDIYLIISTEIKVLNKALYEPNKSKNRLLLFNNENINISNINNITYANLNITPRSLKKKQIIKSLKINNESLNRLDTFYGKSELNNKTNILEETDFNTFYQSTVTKKNKSTNKTKINLKNIIKNNNNQFNFNNSYAEIISPKYNSKTNINNKKNKSKKKHRISLNKKRVSILNLIEQKIDKTKFGQNMDNLYEISTPSNTLYNFNKIQKGNFLSKKDYNTFNCVNKFNCVQKEKNEQDFFKKKNKNKIQINLCGKEQISTERKLNSKKKLELRDYSRLNTDIIKSNNFIFNNKNPNITINNNLNTNIFLQTEAETSTFDNIPENKISINKNILRNLNIKKLKDKNALNNKKIKDETFGIFSPKLSLKLKFDENIMLTEENKTKSKDNQNIYKKLMTPKGTKMKYGEINFTNEKNNENIYEELRKKYLNVFDCYALLIKKIKYNYNRNKLFRKKYDEIKERCHHLNKIKNRISNLREENETKKIINHTSTHFEEEKLISKMISIKLKENSINDLIFSEAEKNTNIINKINIVIGKKENILLNLLKNTVKYYGNISQIYNEDNNKKTKLVTLLEKYNIKEKNSTNFNYINYMNQANSYNDNIITEVDEEKENEEEIDEYIKKNNNIIANNDFISDNLNNIDEENENKIKEIKISIPRFKNSNINKIEKDNNELNYDENLNSLIEKILIEQFPITYNTKLSFVHLEKNKYSFKDIIFFAYIENNDIILKDDIYGFTYTLSEFYNKFCIEDKRGNMGNFIYTKKIRQKYIRLKSYDEKEINNEKKLIRNENNTTMDTDFIQGNEITEEKI